MKRWPLKETYFWETAPFFRLLLPLIAGITFYSIAALHNNVVAGAALITILICVVTGSIKNRNTFTQSLYFISLQLALVCFGWLLSFSNDVTQKPDFFGNHFGKGKYFIARITQTPAAKPRTYKIPVQVLNAIDSNSDIKVEGKAVVYVYKNEDSFTYQRGDTILVSDEWQPIKNAGNPCEFDYAQYAARNNIYYQQFVPANKILLLSKGNDNSSFIDKVHDYCMQQLAIYLPDRKTLGLMQAMLIGDEINLDSETRQSYSETGIVHIIAISGSHITFFFVLISFLLAWIRNKKYHWLKYLLALPLIWFYVLMAGAAPSAVRAAVMFTVLSVGFALQKQPNSLNQLFATAFILLCVEPMWLYSIGFQLSFLAVLSLILFYSRIYQLFSLKNKLLRGAWAAISASLAAELLVAPLVVYYFHLFPLWFVVANLAAYMFMGVVLVAGILIIVFSPVNIIAQVLGTITIFIVSLFNKLVVFFQVNNPRSFSFLHITGFDLMLLYLLIAAIAIFLAHRKGYSIWIASTAALVLATSLLIQSYQASQQKRLVVYNINHVSYAELIDGKYYTPLTNDSVSPTQLNYCVKPAHIQWHAWRQNLQMERQAIYTIGRSTLAISDSIPTAMVSAANYVVIGYPYKAGAVEALQSAYHPEKLVFTSNLSRKQLATWLQACKTAKVPAHAVANDGAFILSAR
jgi:competence protein ComEC